MQTFGCFAGLLVCVNFVSVCTFFPAAVLFYDKYVKKTRFCFGLFDWLPKLFEKKKVPIEDEVEGEEASEPIVEEPKFFFRDTWSPLVEKHAWPILAAFSVFVAIFAVGAALITPTPLEVYTLFPPGSNFYWNARLALTRFPGEANPLQVSPFAREVGIHSARTVFMSVLCSHRVLGRSTSSSGWTWTNRLATAI